MSEWPIWLSNDPVSRRRHSGPHIGTAQDYWDCIAASGQNNPDYVDNDHVQNEGWPIDWSGSIDRCPQR